jgi:hypothetical protein
MDGDADFDEFGGKMEAVNDPAHAEKIFFEYLSKAYAVFLAGDDNYDAMDSELITSFGEFLAGLWCPESGLMIIPTRTCRPQERPRCPSNRAPYGGQ